MDQEPEQFTFDFKTETASIVADSSDELKITLASLPAAGPTVFLIRPEQANIFDIPISKITEEYDLHSPDEEPRHCRRGRLPGDGGDADRDQVEDAAAARSDGAG